MRPDGSSGIVMDASAAGASPCGPCWVSR
jgi:hypothetical protein